MANVPPRPIPYFPLEGDSFQHQFGVRPLRDPTTLCEATETYHQELAVKRQAWRASPADYAGQVAGAEAAEREAFDWLLRVTPFLDERSNHLTGEAIGMDSLPPELPPTPLGAIAWHLQEDLLLLANAPDQGFPLIAGVVCFTSGWSLPEKLGQTILAVHAPVPEFAAQMGKATIALMERLKAERPVCRMNWGIRPSDRLDQSPRFLPAVRRLEAEITPDQVGRRCWFRVERQTLTRLATTQAILFTIHTYQVPLQRLSAAEKTQVAGFVRTCPASTLQYKGIAGLRPALLAYLEP
jgi:hypothetical protein